MPDFLDPTTRKPITVEDPDEAQKLFLAGKVAIPHSEAVVPMADPDGNIVGVLGKHAEAMLQSGGRFVSPTEHRKAYLEQKHGGALGAVQTAAERSIGGGLSMGIGDWAAREFAPKYANEMAERKELRPTLSTVATLGGMAVPILAQEVATEGGATPLVEGELAGAGLGLRGAAEGAEAVSAAKAAQAAPEAADAVHAALQRQAAAGLPADNLVTGVKAGAMASPADIAAINAERAQQVAGATQAAAEAAPAVNPVSEVAGKVSAARVALGYSPPALVSKLGKAMEEMLGPLNLGPKTSKIARLAASGALEGGIYNVADQLDEDALGDNETNAEKIVAAFGHGALTGLVLGGGLGVGAVAGQRILEKAAPYMSKGAKIAAAEQMMVEGGNRRPLAREATRQMGREWKETMGDELFKAKVDVAKPIEAIEPELEGKVRAAGASMEEFTKAADNAGARGVDADALSSSIANSPHAKELMGTPNLAQHVGLQEAPAMVSPEQHVFLEDVAAKRTQRAALEGPDYHDLRERGLVEDDVKLSGLGRKALRQADIVINAGAASELNQKLTGGQQAVLRKLAHHDQILPEIAQSELDDLMTRGLLRERLYGTPIANLSARLRVTEADLSGLDYVRRMGHLADLNAWGASIGAPGLRRALIDRGLIGWKGRLTALGDKVQASGRKLLLNDSEAAVLQGLRESGQAFTTGNAKATVERLIDRGLLKRGYRVTPKGRFVAPMPQAGDLLHLNEQESAAMRLIKDQGTGAAAAHMPDTVDRLVARGLLRKTVKLLPDGKAVLNFRTRTTLGHIIDQIYNAARADGTLSLNDALMLKRRIGAIADFRETARAVPAAKKVLQSAYTAIESAIEKGILEQGGSPALKAYKSAKTTYTALNFAQKFLNESLIAKDSKLHFGLKEMGMTGIGATIGGHFGPLGVVAGVGAGLASKYVRRRAPGYAAVTMNKLANLGFVEKAAAKVDRVVDASAIDWINRVSRRGESGLGKGALRKGKAPEPLEAIRKGGKVTHGDYSISKSRGTGGYTFSKNGEKLATFTTPQKAHAALQKAAGEHADRAKAVIDQLHSLRAHGPVDAAQVSQALGGLANHAPKVTGQLANKLNAISQLIASKVPADHADYSDVTQPGTNHISSLEYKDFDDTVRGAIQPLDAFMAFSKGTATQAQMQGAKAAVPKVFDQFQAAVLRELAKDPVRAQKIPFQAKMGMAFALGVPTNWALQSAGVRFLQSDRSSVAGSPQSKMGGNQMGKKVSFKNDLSANLETQTEKMESRLPGRGGKRR